MTAAILPYTARKPGKKRPGAIFRVAGTAPRGVRPWMADHEKSPEGISNLAQRRPEGWPPGMSGHKKPVGSADKACAVPCRLCQTGNGDFGVRTWP